MNFAAVWTIFVQSLFSTFFIYFVKNCLTDADYPSWFVNVYEQRLAQVHAFVLNAIAFEINLYSLLQLISKTWAICHCCWKICPFQLQFKYHMIQGSSILTLMELLHITNNINSTSRLIIWWAKKSNSLIRVQKCISGCLC